MARRNELTEDLRSIGYGILERKMTIEFGSKQDSNQFKNSVILDYGNIESTTDYRQDDKTLTLWYAADNHNTLMESISDHNKFADPEDLAKITSFEEIAPLVPGYKDMIDLEKFIEGRRQRRNEQMEKNANDPSM